MNVVTFEPIGVIRTPFASREGMPIQPSAAEGTAGTIELKHELTAGLKDLDGFSHIILIYHFDRSEGYALEVVPFLDTVMRGVFATRAPRRPNAIGLSIVRLVRVTENILEIEDVDMMDGTPLLDIKPFVGEFDARKGCRVGWLEGKAVNARHTQSDKRFMPDA